MKKLLSTVLLTITIMGTLRADLGAPTIQAICKVTLKDGKTVEGIITFGPGGYEGNYKPHGFCFMHDNGVKQLILYDLSFGQFTPENYAAHRSGTSKLYYVKNVSKQRFIEKKTEFDEKENIITQTTIEIDEYKLLDEMVMYKKLPLSLYVGFNQNKEDDKIAIKVSEIKSVMILKNPKQEWLDLIDTARKRRENSNEVWVDYMEPVWYHEIINDKETVTYLKQFF